MRDRDSRLRAAALSLLSLLLRPAAGPTQRLLAAGWPDAAPRLIRLALAPAHAPSPNLLNPNLNAETYGVRAAALRVLCAALALPADPPPPPPHGALDPDQALTAAYPASSLSAEALLKQAHFWEQLPSLLLDKAAPPAFHQAALALLLQGLLVQVNPPNP